MLLFFHFTRFCLSYNFSSGALYVILPPSKFLEWVFHAYVTGRPISQKQGKGKQSHTNCSIDMEIIVNYVKRVEILLVPTDTLYASYTLYWYCVFWIGSFLVVCCCKFENFCIASFFCSIFLNWRMA